MYYRNQETPRFQRISPDRKQGYQAGKRDKQEKWDRYEFKRFFAIGLEYIRQHSVIKQGAISGREVAGSGGNDQG